MLGCLCGSSFGQCMVEKVSAFFVGNVVGLTILVAGVLLTAPKKLKETEIIQKQQSAMKEQAAQALQDRGNTKDLADTATSEGPTNTRGPTTSAASTSTSKTSLPGNSDKRLTPYVVSTVEIAKGQKIDASAIKLQNMPTTGHQDAISDAASVVGKTTTIDIRAGETITVKALRQ